MKRKIIIATLGLCLAIGFGTTVYATEGDVELDGAQSWETPAAGTAAAQSVPNSRASALEDPASDTTETEEPGWKTEDGRTYYVKEDGSYETGYKLINGEDGEHYYYFDSQGVMQTGLQKINGNLHWFHEDGKAMGKGWVNCHDGNKRYGEGDGKLKVGYKKIGKDHYYLDTANGAMAKGAAIVNGKPYYFKTNGKAALKGWVKVNGAKKYYSLGKGKLKTGWTSINSYGYYFYPKTGEMAKATKVKGVKINKSGRLDKAYGRAIKVLDKKGWNLKAAFNYSARLRYYRPMPRTAKPGSAWFANYGFTKGKGNCYVMAATFYYMAKVMGYDVHQISGFVGTSPHSWCIIKHKKGTYVYDTNFTNETGRNGYKIKYGQRGTWRYARSKSHRMN